MPISLEQQTMLITNTSLALKELTSTLTNIKKLKDNKLQCALVHAIATSGVVLATLTQAILLNMEPSRIQVADQTIPPNLFKGN